MSFLCVRLVAGASLRRSLERRPACAGPTLGVGCALFVTNDANACRARQFASTAAVRATKPASQNGMDRIRNVSFWGHIDAGKTTLTEKVLYLANALLPPDASASSSAASRMLPGDVDSGSTVTDFLEAERQRGITIQSAAVGPFVWKSDGTATDKEAKITLIDTPGHIDFTIEVERSLRVADGCVVLIDGVEGVESQTEGVWQIAQRYGVRSHIVFVNKLDRTGSSLHQSIRSIVRAGVHARPTLLQLPVFAADTSSTSSMDQEALVGLVDLTSWPMVAHFYGGKAGEDVRRTTIDEALEHGKITKSLYDSAKEARSHLVEHLANLDEQLMEQTLSAMETDGGDGSYTDAIDMQSVRQAVRRLVAHGEILPVLCGSAARGVGVQAVLDAISDYLPSPGEAGDREAAQARGQAAGCVWGQVRKGMSNKQVMRQIQQQQKKKTAASTAVVEQAQSESQVGISVHDPTLSLLAFKVVWDKRKGPMTFVRIYSGTLTRTSTLLNTQTGVRERLSKILFVYADRHVETDKLEAGQIGVLLGLRDTRTGDTLVDAKAATSASKRSPSGKDGSLWTSFSSTLALRKINVPPPVFSMSIEPASKSDEGPLREALDMLIRTDPSLHLDQETVTAGTGSSGGGGASSTSDDQQMVLSGMGELHLDIARDRLVNEFNVRAQLGNVRVSYRETAVNENDDNEPTVLEDQVFEREVMGQRLKAGCRITLRNLTSVEADGDPELGGNLIAIEDAPVENEEPDDAHPQSTDEAEDASEQVDSDSIRRAIHSGLVVALSRGPLSGNPITGVHVHVDEIQTFGATASTPKAFRILAIQALREAIKVRGSEMMEPFMNVRIQCDDTSLGKIVSNLTSEQGGMIEHVDHAAQEETKTSDEDDTPSTPEDVQLAQIYLPPIGQFEGADGQSGALDQRQGEKGKCTIQAVVPLVHLVRYSSTLRALSRGTATYEMAFRGFQVVQPDRLREILEELGRTPPTEEMS